MVSKVTEFKLVHDWKAYVLNILTEDGITKFPVRPQDRKALNPISHKCEPDSKETSVRFAQSKKAFVPIDLREDGRVMLPVRFDLANDAIPIVIIGSGSLLLTLSLLKLSDVKLAHS